MKIIDQILKIQYPFDDFILTGNAIGSTGPTVEELSSTYPKFCSDKRFLEVQNGIQKLTFYKTGHYLIKASGAGNNDLLGPKGAVSQG